MPVTIVPAQDPGQTELPQPLYATPYSTAWWQLETITDIPPDAVGWHVAQGWQIVLITYDETLVPKVPYYKMQRYSLRNWLILQSLLDDYISKLNLALENNTIRYNDVIDSWEAMIDTTTQNHFVNMTSEQNTHTTAFLADLQAYIDEVDALLVESQNQLDQMEPDYGLHAVESPQFLIDLGATELARINEEFASQLADQLQLLADRGLYSSAIAADITERNARDRDEQVQLLNDRLNREKLENEHRLYEQQQQMRSRIIDGTNSIVATTINQANIDLAGQQAKHDETIRMMTYQLDEKNKLLVGLYGFVERRDDIAPTFESLTQLVTSLGDAGGGWVTP